jgi:dipeptide/tripeptide permease
MPVRGFVGTSEIMLRPTTSSQTKKLAIAAAAFRVDSNYFVTASRTAH